MPLGIRWQLTCVCGEADLDVAVGDSDGSGAERLGGREAGGSTAG